MSHLKGGNYAGDASSLRAGLAISTRFCMDYYGNAISFDALYKALKRVCRNVRWKDSVVGYANNDLRNTLVLHNALADGTYKISKYQVFTIREP